MTDSNYLTLNSNGSRVVISRSRVLYVEKIIKHALIHTYDGAIYRSRISIRDLKELLGDEFIKIHQGCLVHAMAIHSITDVIHLVNGKTLHFAKRKKQQIVGQFIAVRKSSSCASCIDFAGGTAPSYQSHYRSFESLPVAFADIELLPDERGQTFDYVLRYANPKFSELLGLPPDILTGVILSDVFSHTDCRWLKQLAGPALRGEAVELTKYIPQIDTCLKIISFPTFAGHCGCFLFDASKLRPAEVS